MQVSPIPSISPPGQAAKAATTAEQAKPDQPAAPVKTAWVPAPPLRPTVQDRIDVNLTLLLLRLNGR